MQQTTLSAGRRFPVSGFCCLMAAMLIHSRAQPPTENMDKFLGNCLGNTIYSNYTNYWNQVTPGNAGKWGSVEYTRNSYNWTQLDNIYNMALTKGILYKHHTLVWGQQQPGWITTLDSAGQRAELEEWFQLVGERYPQMEFVDVVNEPFHAPPAYKEALGGDGVTGWDWVISSFELARQHLPDRVKLILNEYNILHDNTVTTNYLEIINLLQERILIDGIGIQGHYFEFKGSGYTYSISTIKSNLNRLAATGLPVYITEFDINEADDNVQLQNYQTYFPIFWEHPGVKGITLWGYVEGDMWKENAYLLKYTGRPRPAFEWLLSYIKSPLAPKLISPVAPETGHNVPCNPVLLWHSAATAESYHVQLAIASSFGPTAMVLDTVVADTVLQVDSLQVDKIYYWHVAASNEHGMSFYSATAAFRTAVVNAIPGQSIGFPADYCLFQNFPNPFNSTTTIRFSIAYDGFIYLRIHDLTGRVIRTLVNQRIPAGEYTVHLHADDRLNSGLYFYTIDAGDFTHTKKLMIIK